MIHVQEEHYAVDDIILPVLRLPVPAGVRIDIYETCVRLQIGPRDYEWPRGCPNVCATGTSFQEPIQGPQKEDL